MSKVLVTGGAGFIGSHLVDALLKRGHEIVVIDNFSTGRRENLDERAKIIEADISDFDSIARFFEGCEVVFHMAAQARIQPSIKNPLPANQSNITGTLNILWASHFAHVQKFIYSGSSSVYGDQPELPLREDFLSQPKNPYALQKLVGEMYSLLFSQLYNLPTVSLRYFNVYGPRQLVDGPYATVIGIFLEQVKSGKPMTIVGNGQQRRDFTNVKDVVRANLLAWEKDVAWGEVINIGTGRNYSVNEVAKIIGGETVNIQARPGETRVTLADNSKAKKVLGWEPKVSLEEEISELKQLHGLQPHPPLPLRNRRGMG